MSADDLIVIVAPCPAGTSAREGWMSRVQSVDRIFSEWRRIYLDPYSGASEGPPIAVEHDDLVTEYRVDLMQPSHHRLMEDLVARSRLTYVHTAHLGRYLLPLYPTGKIVTDMHGIVPEEERMLGRPAFAAYYETVESFILANSPVIVVVTEAMADHFRAKYPHSPAHFITLPIIEEFDVDWSRRRKRTAGEPYRVIYAGGIQAWQNVDRMIEIASAAPAPLRFEFLSNQHETIRSLAAETGLAQRAEFGVVAKEELSRRYLDADLGFVLRDDTAVNRVSCPTKLSEYLAFGVIPIVRSPRIGDFDREGFAYVTDEELSLGLIPDEVTAGEMRETNRAVLARLAGRFAAASNELLLLARSSSRTPSRLGGLPIGQRHLCFPSQAELYIFTHVMHHYTREVVDFYNSTLWLPSCGEAARAIRVIPMLAHQTVRLDALKLTIADDASSKLQISCATPGVLKSGGIYLSKSKPYFDFNLSPPVMINSVEPVWSFVDVGVRDATADREAKPLTVHVEVERSNGSRVLTLDIPVSTVI